MSESAFFAFKPFHHPTRLSVEELAGLYYRNHLAHIPSGATFKSNLGAWCKTTGPAYVDALTHMEVRRHDGLRASGFCGKPAGNGTRRHDIKLLGMMLNWAARLKQSRIVLEGFPFGTLALPLFPPAKGFKRPPRPAPRQNTVTPDDFSVLMEHAHPDLRERLIFSMDTGANPCDLMILEAKHFDHATKTFRFVRQKTRHMTGKLVVLPATDRCIKIMYQSIAEKRPYILKWKDCEWEARKQLNEARILSRLHNFQLGRDCRKTDINRLIKEAKGDIRPAQKMAGHASPQTTWDYYYIDDGADIRPYVTSIERDFQPKHKVLVNLPKERFFQN